MTGPVLLDHDVTSQLRELGQQLRVDSVRASAADAIAAACTQLVRARH
jgi:hypothetical protein